MDTATALSSQMSRPVRKVSITVQGLSDLTPLTWLQYHHAIVVYHRNRLASLPVGQILSFANLHFNQITTFEQVEMLPLSHRQFEILASKVLGIALNDHRKSIISMKEAKKTGGLYKDQFDTTQTPETLSLLMAADHSLVIAGGGGRGFQEGIVATDNSLNVPVTTAPELVPGNEPKAQDDQQPPPHYTNQDNINLPDFSGDQSGTTTIPPRDSSSLKDRSGMLDEGSDLDDDEDISMPPPTELDNDVDGQNDGNSSQQQQSQPPTRVHVLDASLNRIRRLAFSSVTIWNVRSILFMNLSGNLLVSLDGIECCKNLVVLDSSDNILTHMHPLRGCIQLKRLRINGNHLVNVSLDDPADHLPDAQQHDPATATATGKPYPALDYLDINNNHLDSVNGLKGLKNFGQSLVHFEMRNCNLSTSAFAELEGSALLESLHADNNRIDSLKPIIYILKGMPKLRHLSLLGNPVAGRGSSSSTVDTPGGDTGDFSTAEEKHESPKVGQTKSTLGVDILNSFGLNYNLVKSSVQTGTTAPDKHPPALGEGKERSHDSEQQVSMYAITILDNVPRLKTFDHLAVSSALYSDLARLKTQIIGEDMLYEISNKYSREITKTMRVHDNLVAKHRVDAELVELAVKSKMARLEQEMEEVMHFGREKLESLRPKYAIDQHFNTDSNPQEVLESISTMREKVATPFSTL